MVNQSQQLVIFLKEHLTLADAKCRDELQTQLKRGGVLNRIGNACVVYTNNEDHPYENEKNCEAFTSYITTLSYSPNSSSFHLS